MFDRPQTSDNDLAAAFEPEAPPPTTAESAPKPPAAPPPPPPREDPSAAQRTSFAEKHAAANRALAARSLDEAGPLVEQLESSAEALGPLEQQQAAELAFKLAKERQQGKEARRAAERWLLSCGPEKVDGCRSKALGALGALGRSKLPEAAGARERATQARAADECLRKSEAAARTKKPVLPCLDSAAGTYKRMRDGLMVARAHLAKGMAALADPKKKGEAVAQLARVEKDCQEPRCAAIRRRALKQLGWHHAREGNLEEAARAMLLDMELGAESLPPEERQFARTSEADKACSQLDAKEGAGTCRRLERALLGGYVFRDYSKQHAGRELTPEQVRTVNEHFGVTMQECLAVEAERLVPPASVTYELRWMVTNDGRVDQLRLGRRDQESSPLADCLRKQFVVWRYPRYEGEAQHVEQRFTVNARERRH